MKPMLKWNHSEFKTKGNNIDWKPQKIDPTIFFFRKIPRKATIGFTHSFLEDNMQGTCDQTISRAWVGWPTHFGYYLQSVIGYIWR